MPLPQLPVDGLPFALERSAGRDAGLSKARVTQCALSRICGVCAESLGRPIAFLATTAESDADAIHLPPMHEVCAHDLHAAYAGRWDQLGQFVEPAGWVLVTTAAFEFIRPAKESRDKRPVFTPSVVIDRVALAPAS